jgi:transcriptional regulator with XRE-family HTH domain
MAKPAISKDNGSTGAILKNVRQQAELTQDQAAKLLHTTQSYISKIESGQRRVHVARLKDFARVYKKGVGYFLK